MKVLVDTSVWSLALRRKTPGNINGKLINLILASQAVMIGPVRQELLSGISDEEIFESLKSRLEPFEDLQITTSDHETAAQFFNICRVNGIQGSHIDFLICAVAVRGDLHIFTTDKDFELFSKYLPIRLFEGKTQH